MRREIIDLASKPGHIVDHPRLAPGMHGNVVPRRHDLAVPVLCRVERRADVLVRSLENDKAFGNRGQFVPLRIGACEVSTQRATLRAVGVDQERDGVGLQPVPSRR